jgi:uncharacterized repeat protein (TIGR03803 family)
MIGTMTVKAVCKVAALSVLLPAIVATQSASAQTFSVLYTFPQLSDGLIPGLLFQDSTGNLYGAAARGGTAETCFNHQCVPGCQGLGCGVVFKLDPSGKLTALHNFTGPDGNDPSLSFRDTNGNLYGTAVLGGSGACGCGIIFVLDTTGKETVLHSFAGGAEGMYPSGRLLPDANGNLYGVTVAGGDLTCQGIEGSGTGCGVVFRLDKTGNLTVLHTFTGVDGASPTGELVQDDAGSLYGTTVGGGNSSCPPVGGCGVIFKLDTAGDETVLHSFTGGADGGYPTSLLRDTVGNLYGMSYYGGSTKCSGGCGVIFKVDTTGQLTVLHSFTGADGSGPWGRLLLDATGNLYGMTGSGGDLACPHAGGCGVAFKLDMATGVESVLHSFTGGADGWYPVAALLQGSDGDLYGSTAYGGQLTCPSSASGSGCGVIFKFANALPDFSLTPASSSLIVNAGDQGTDVITVAPQNGAFGSAIQLSCVITGPTPIPTCALSPASVTPGANSTNSTLTITAPASAMLMPSVHLRLRSFYALWLPLVMVGMIPIVTAKPQRRRQWVLCGLLLLLFLLQIACGGGSGAGGGTTQPPKNYTVTVTGAALGGIQHTTQMTLMIQ